MMHTLHLLSGIVYYAPFCSASQSIGCRLGGGAKRRNTWTSHPLAIPVVPIPPPGPSLALSLHSTLHKPYSNPRTGPKDECAANYALLGLHTWAYRCTVVALQP